MKILSALLCVLFFFTGACAYKTADIVLDPDIVEQMNWIYDSWIEKGFCVSAGSVRGVHNVLEGDIFSSPMPLCFPDDIVFHTHSWFSESCANFADWAVWETYKERYGNTYFGIMFGKDNYTIYER